MIASGLHCRFLGTKMSGIWKVLEYTMLCCATLIAVCRGEGGKLVGLIVRHNIDRIASFGFRCPKVGVSEIRQPNTVIETRGRSRQVPL